MEHPSEPPTNDGRSGRTERRSQPALPVHERRLRLAGGAVLLAACAAVVGSLLGLGSSGSSSAEAEKRAASPWQQARARLAVESRTIDRTLARTPYVSRGSGGERNVALTFDDGPGAQTAQILETLERFDADATFFSLGAAVAEYPRQNRAALLAGHSVGNHTYDHPRLAYLPEAEQARQIDSATDALRREGPYGPRLFRPPYGSFDATTLDLLRERALLMVLWSVDATDFGGADREAVAARVLDEVEPGSIVLMHDGGGDRTETVAALAKVLRGLERRGLEPVTVPELLATNPPPADQPPPVSLDGMP
jgi:peptidoglycan/xylan/chitin deacetylase (PgdA/CDA1 family)